MELLMNGRSRILVSSSLLLAGCISPGSSDATPCGDGFCAPGLVCQPDGTCAPEGVGGDGQCGHDDDFVGTMPLLDAYTDDELNPSLSSDEKTIVYSHRRRGHYELRVATRADVHAPFGSERAIDEVNTPGIEWRGSLGRDGRLYYDTQAPGGGRAEIWWASPTGSMEALRFEGAAHVPGIAAEGNDLEPFVTEEGMYFASSRADGNDLYLAPRIDGGFGAPQPLDLVNTRKAEETPVVSRDGKALYYVTVTDPSAPVDFDIWVARRASTDEPFGSPELLNSVSGAGYQAPGWLSDDNCRLYYTYDDDPDGGENFDIRVAYRRPRS
jgi:hypothetical protein